MRAQRLEIIPIEGMPLVKELDDLSELILTILSTRLHESPRVNNSFGVE